MTRSGPARQPNGRISALPNPSTMRHTGIGPGGAQPCKSSNNSGFPASAGPAGPADAFRPKASSAVPRTLRRHSQPPSGFPLAGMRSATPSAACANCLAKGESAPIPGTAIRSGSASNCSVGSGGCISGCGDVSSALQIIALTCAIPRAAAVPTATRDGRTESILLAAEHFASRIPPEMHAEGVRGDQFFAKFLAISIGKEPMHRANEDVLHQHAVARVVP